MKPLPGAISAHFLLALSTAAFAAESGPRFYGDPPDAHHPWAVHDGNRPQPKIVTPGTFSTPEQPGHPPSDAILLFDGADLSQWESAKDGGAAKWQVHDGVLQVEPGTGDIRTKRKFGDCQLHVEWAAPTDVSGTSQERGNSGIFLMGLVEIQVLESYQNITYADGHAGAVYGVNPPMANVIRPPGEFQVYDIIFRKPLYEDGQMIDPGYVTVMINGVVVQDHTRLEGPTGHMVRAKPAPFPEAGPLELQDHGNRMRFRNIWFRELPPRPIEGGTDGYLSTEETMLKRREIAGSILRDAEHSQNSNDPAPQLLRLMESLVYLSDPDVARRVQELAVQYVADLKALSPDDLAAKKDEVKTVSGAFRYLARFKILPNNLEPATALEQLIREKGWNKRRNG